MPISFDFHKLGWKAFEDLAACMFRDILGQTFQSFSIGKDGGRDGAFHGVWRTEKSETMSGTFAVQCKHSSTAGKALTLSIINDELPKIGRLSEQGLADNYILVTNYALSGGQAEIIEQKFLAAGAKNAKVLGSDWMASTIEANPKLRRLVPRIYGLGDLTQIITHQAYRQACEVLDSVSQDLACFVPTDAYRKCARALQEHGFVLLLGEPASGKTMIANLMALSAADEWQLQTLMLTGPSDFSKYWNPDDPGQFLWVDDAFGATQYDGNRVKEWNHLLPKLKGAIRSGARVVFTSRDYIFSSAKRDLKMTAFELFDDSRVTIHVEKLSDAERQMILYNHLKSGTQPSAYKKAVKPYLIAAASVPKFLPEIARRFGNAKFTEQVIPTENSVLSFFEKPLHWLQGVLSNLAPAESAAIALVFIAGGRLPIPLPDNKRIKTTILTMQSNIGEVKSALVSLNDSLLRRVRENSHEYWMFRHPTIRDAFANLVGGNPELIDIYLAGVSTDQLLNEVICGDIAVEGAKIVIPPEKFNVVLTRLRAFKLEASNSFFFNPVITFLVNRCSIDFLECYYVEHDLMELLPNYIWDIGAYNGLLTILKRMHDANLLPEHVRAAAAERIISICEKSYSLKFLETDIVGKLLESTNTEERVRNIVNEVLSSGEDIIGNLKADWNRDSDPDDEFTELKRTLNLVMNDERLQEYDSGQADDLLREINWAVEVMNKLSSEADYETLDTESAATETPPTGRSIFDDVDE